MRIGPRAKLVLLMALFAAPVIASTVTYRFFRPAPTANYGELLLPPDTITSRPFDRIGGGRFSFEDLRGSWVLVASDGGACATACAEKLFTLRQARLALGRDASRVERVFVADDGRRTDARVLAPFEGTVAIAAPRSGEPPRGATADRAHIYLVDPNGNVMMRWPAAPEPKRMIRDLERLLKASQIG